jgi:hypothetical protein
MENDMNYLLKNTMLATLAICAIDSSMDTSQAYASLSYKESAPRTAEDLAAENRFCSALRAGRMDEAKAAVEDRDLTEISAPTEFQFSTEKVNELIGFVKWRDEKGLPQLTEISIVTGANAEDSVRKHDMLKQAFPHITIYTHHF